MGLWWFTSHTPMGNDCKGDGGTLPIASRRAAYYESATTAPPASALRSGRSSIRQAADRALNLRMKPTQETARSFDRSERILATAAFMWKLESECQAIQIPSAPPLISSLKAFAKNSNRNAHEIPEGADASELRKNNAVDALVRNPKQNPPIPRKCGLMSRGTVESHVLKFGCESALRKILF